MFCGHQCHFSFFWVNHGLLACFWAFNVVRMCVVDVIQVFLTLLCVIGIACVCYRWCLGIFNDVMCATSVAPCVASIILCVIIIACVIHFSKYSFFWSWHTTLLHKGLSNYYTSLCILKAFKVLLKMKKGSMLLNTFYSLNQSTFFHMFP